MKRSSIMQSVLLAWASLSAAAADLHYDYVIVGGGTSGLVLANRLSEIQNITVAVIEAGGSVLNNPNVTDPLGFTEAFGTDIDWSYTTVPQKYGGNQTLAQHGGKALGGTSTINGMSYTRTQNFQIDAWQTLGNDGWNWTALFPYYKKSEHLEIPTASQLSNGAVYDPDFHGYDGPLKTGWLYEITNGTVPALINDTLQNLGVPFKDFNGGEMRGFSAMPQTVDRDANLREDAARAYYWPIHEERSNLVVYLNTTAQRIAWKDDTQEVIASGVEVISQNGTAFTISANKEVILSAGSLRSPGLLEYSGIGNPDILSTFNIPLKVNLPSVGENLQDQPNVAMETSLSLNATGFGEYVAYVNASDIFASSFSSVSADVYSSLSSYAATVSAASNNALNKTHLEAIFAVQYDLIFNQHLPIAEILLVPTSTGLFESAMWGIFPFARGSVHIASMNTSVKPTINPNFFMLEWDRLQQINTMRYVQNVFESKPLAGVLGDEIKIAPGLATVPQNGTDAEWLDLIFAAYTSNNHPVSTAAMMPQELGGVVDNQLKVYGTENVRVVDASILPFQLVGHLTSTLYAVAERAADLIKEDM